MAAWLSTFDIRRNFWLRLNIMPYVHKYARLLRQSSNCKSKFQSFFYNTCNTLTSYDHQTASCDASIIMLICAYFTMIQEEFFKSYVFVVKYTIHNIGGKLLNQISPRVCVYIYFRNKKSYEICLPLRLICPVKQE